MTIVEFETELERAEVVRIRESVDGDPNSRPLGTVYLNTYSGHRDDHARFNEENALLCSLCDRPAVAIYLIPWCVLTNEVRALCLECTDEPSPAYHIDADRLWRNWNATLTHLAWKSGGGGAVQLLRWFNYSGLCKFLGFDDLHRWPIARGIITPELRAQVLERDGYKCRKCHTTENLTIDHVRPVSAGGFTTAINLQVLCQSCNSRKGGVRRKQQGPRQAPIVVARPRTSLGDRALEYLRSGESMTSPALAGVLGVNGQYLNRTLRSDARFRCVREGNGRGRPSIWTLA